MILSCLFCHSDLKLAGLICKDTRDIEEMIR